MPDNDPEGAPLMWRTQVTSLKRRILQRFQGPTRSLLTLLLLLSAAWPAIAQVGRLPGLLYEKSPRRIRAHQETQARPTWVSARLAARNGNFDPALFTPDQIDSLRSLITPVDIAKPANVPGCLYQETGIRPPNSIRQLVRASTLIVEGTIASEDPGIFGGLPQTIYGIAVDTVHKAPNNWTPLDRVYVTYQTVLLNLEDGAICLLSDSYPSSPQIGGRVLAFAYDWWQSEDPTIRVLLSPDGWLVFDTQEHRPYVPGPAGSDSPSDWDSITLQLREALRTR